MEGGMANLYPRGAAGTLYAKFKYQGVSVHCSTGTKDLKLAKDWVEKKKHEIYSNALKPTILISKVPTLQDALDNTYQDVWSVTGNQEYGEQQHQKVRTCIEILGNIPLDQLDTDKIRTLRVALRKLSYRGKALTEATVNKYLTALRVVYQQHSSIHKLAPIKWNIPKNAGAKGRVRVFTKEEQEQIVSWFLEHDMQELADLCVVLSETGFRMEEALGIGKREKGVLISEFDLEREQVISWINKGNEVRMIPLLTKSLTILQRRGTIAFPSFTGDDKKIYRIWKRMREDIGLGEECTPHVFRHTCASRLIKAGASLKEVQVWLGHKDIQTTMIYLHLFPNQLRAAADRIKNLEECD